MSGVGVHDVKVTTYIKKKRKRPTVCLIKPYGIIFFIEVPSSHMTPASVKLTSN